MAKKKAVRRKAVKKKAVKKKAVKKTPTRRAATVARKKTSAKKPAGQAGVAPPIKFRCRLGSSTATPKFSHMSPGDSIDLTAVNADVTIDFVIASPFVSGTNPVHIPNGTTITEQVSPGANGTYEYRLTCPPCRTSSGNPEMIVP